MHPVTTVERDEFLVALQGSFRPPVLPRVPFVEIGVSSRSYNPYFEVGGDWYDIVEREDEMIAMVGDVVGHGIAQINVMGQLRAAANALARICTSPMEIIDTLDGIASDLPGAKHSTAVIVCLDASGQGQVASAGHPPMLRVSPAGKAEPVMVGRRMPLALGGPTQLGTFNYEPGDLFVIYTDGVIDRADYGLYEAMARVGDIASSCLAFTCNEIAETIMDDVRTRARDDAVAMVLRPEIRLARP